MLLTCGRDVEENNLEMTEVVIHGCRIITCYRGAGVIVQLEIGARCFMTPNILEHFCSMRVGSFSLWLNYCVIP